MPKRILQGTVTSDANAQTVTISVERRFKHPVLAKDHPEVTKKYRAHDENNEYKVGDTVRIQECAPKSKTKRWEGGRARLTRSIKPRFDRNPRPMCQRAGPGTSGETK